MSFAANAKSYLIEPIVIAQALDIPVFVLFDADGNKMNPDQRVKHEKDNRALLKLLGGNNPIRSLTRLHGEHPMSNGRLI